MKIMKLSSCIVILLIIGALSAKVTFAQTPNNYTFLNGNVGIGLINPVVNLDIVQNGAFKVGTAYLSSGGDNLHLATHEYYNGSAWVSPDSVAGGLFQISGQSFNWYSHTGAASPGHTAMMSLNNGGWSGGSSINLVKGPAVTDSNDGWLRLNSGSQYANGLYTPGNTRADGNTYIGPSYAWYPYGAGIATNGTSYLHYIYDLDNTAYNLDPNGYSNTYVLYRAYGYNGPEYDINSPGYYVDPNGVSNLNYVYRSQGFNGIEYDVNNNNFYADPSYVSNFNYLYRSQGFNGIEYDVNDNNYYMDPSNYSRTNIFLANNYRNGSNWAMMDGTSNSAIVFNGGGNFSYSWFYGQLYANGRLIAQSGINAECDPKVKGSNCNADIAEIYASSEDVSSGDVLIINDSSQEVKKSKEKFDKKLMGVVTTSPAIIMGYKEGTKSAQVLMAGDANTYEQKPEAKRKPAVALAGKAPIKVNLEGGAIKKGDYLTSSSTPGVAMKATKPGQVIAKALADYSGGGDGKVLSLINNSYADPNGDLDKLQTKVEDLEARLAKMEH